MNMSNELDSIRKNSIALGIFALVTTILLATTYQTTKGAIAKAQHEAEQKALLEIIPPQHQTDDLSMEVLPIPKRFWPALGLDEKGPDSASQKNSHSVYVVRNEAGYPTTIILPAIAPDGYSGKIKMIIGINIDGTISGVRITKHQETPGLGDKVDLTRSDWVLGFNQKSLLNPALSKWEVKKDRGEFDQFTGATITPRAVIHQVARALQYYTEDKTRLLQEAEYARSFGTTTAPAPE